MVFCSNPGFRSVMLKHFLEFEGWCIWQCKQAQQSQRHFKPCTTLARSLLFIQTYFQNIYSQHTEKCSVSYRLSLFSQCCFYCCCIQKQMGCLWYNLVMIDIFNTRHAGKVFLKVLKKAAREALLMHRQVGWIVSGWKAHLWISENWFMVIKLHSFQTQCDLKSILMESS